MEQQSHGGRGADLVCELCGCRFKRTEHLSRHVLSHRGSKPHICQTCGKSFTRRDTLVRHMPIHSSSTRSSRRSTARVSRACVQCARSRLRCDGDSPCGRCRTNGHNCTPAGRPRNCIPLVEELAHGPAAQSTINMPTAPASITPTMLPTPRDDENHSAHTAMDTTSPTIVVADGMGINFPHALPTPSRTTDELAAGYIYPAENDFSMQQQQPGFDLSWAWSNDFHVLDWIGFDPAVNMVDETAFRNPRWPDSVSLTDGTTVTTASRLSSSGQPPPSPQTEAEAPRPVKAHQWPTDWDPVKSDNIVSFPDSSTIPLDVLEAESFAHVEGLSQQVYEEIEKCLSRTTSIAGHFRGCHNPRLPPIEAIDCFVQLYFEHFHPTFPMLHKPTFNPAQAPWQLVLATAAVGCRFSRAPNSGQWADALQELLGRGIADTVETDNSAVREIWLAQAMQLNFFGMTYNGNKRHLEAAEVYRNGCSTYCRRIGAFRRSPQRTGPLFNGDERPEMLERQWRNWVMEESRRRLGFCCFLRDAQVGLYFDFNPCMNPKELQQPLPCLEELWEASDAEKWKEQYLNISEYEQSQTIDMAVAKIRRCEPLGSTIGDFARLILVCVTYQTMLSVQNMVENPLLAHSVVNVVSTEDFHNFATNVLEALKPLPSERRGSSSLKASVNLHILLVLMLLFTPRQQLLNHAHAYNTDQEQPELRYGIADWMNADGGRTARRAVAHAGRLLGALGTCKSQGAHEPIMLLMCIVTLWTYSLMVDMGNAPHFIGGGGGSVNDKSRKDRGTIVRLDDLDFDPEDWINGRTHLPGHIKNVGNIGRPGAALQILGTGIAALKELGPWGVGQGWGMWLVKLKTRLHASAEGA